MKLNRYLSLHDMTLTDFAKKVGVSAEAVRRYSNGQRMPRPKQLQRIREVTNGAVEPNDFIQRRRGDAA